SLRETCGAPGAQDPLERLRGRQLHPDLLAASLDREGAHLVVGVGEALARLQRERLLVQRARDLRLARLVAEQAAREHVVLAVRTRGLRREPLAAAREVVDRELDLPVADRS